MKHFGAITLIWFIWKFKLCGFNINFYFFLFRWCCCMISPFELILFEGWFFSWEYLCWFYFIFCSLLTSTVFYFVNRRITWRLFYLKFWKIFIKSVAGTRVRGQLRNCDLTFCSNQKIVFKTDHTLLSSMWVQRFNNLFNLHVQYIFLEIFICHLNKAIWIDNKTLTIKDKSF